MTAVNWGLLVVRVVKLDRVRSQVDRATPVGATLLLGLLMPKVLAADLWSEGNRIKLKRLFRRACPDPP